MLQYRDTMLCVCLCNSALVNFSVIKSNEWKEIKIKTKKIVKSKDEKLQIILFSIMKGKNYLLNYNFYLKRIILIVLYE